eukprot:3907236-Rhodomonas_salina.1
MQVCSFLAPADQAVHIGAARGCSWVHIRKSTETHLYHILPNNPGTNVFYEGGGGACSRLSGIPSGLYLGIQGHTVTWMGTVQHIM